MTPGKCLPNDKTFYALAGVTILYDCIIFLLPIPILLQLQINARRKAGLIGMFVLGLFTTVCSVMRMVQIITIAKTGNSTMLVLWGTIEMNVGVSIISFKLRRLRHSSANHVRIDCFDLYPNTDTSLRLLPREIHYSQLRRTVRVLVFIKRPNKTSAIFKQSLHEHFEIEELEPENKNQRF